MEDNQPKGIGFFNLKSGETHYGRLEPQIQAYINSSDLGINASRGQDFGWRLSPEWVKKVRAFRADENKMATLSAKLRLEDDQLPNLTQVLYAIYGQQLRAAHSRAQEDENPFEEEYLQAIGGNVAASADPLDRYDEDGGATEEPVEQVAPTPVANAPVKPSVATTAKPSKKAQ
jgi:hypothetical protein